MEIMEAQTLNIEQAYRAMFYFLEKEYERTKADEIGGLLSFLAWETTGGHGPADPGAWEDWEVAVTAALAIADNAAPNRTISDLP
ncbi:hypothetical protein [Achromobacter sp. Root83]|uniref:hypothetical protein n=1 Tax=Achromobacter sp. Root83 TaxID=1736602 RepID=UPI001F378A92|nr:hypothetical protein [Achromobacter sp. Root83]